MATVELATRIKAPVERVWAILTGPEMVQLMLDTYAASIDVQPAPNGSFVFTTTMKDGGVVRECVDEFDHDERCMRYHALDIGPFPYANYRGEARLQPCGSSGCVLSFQASFIPIDCSADDASAIWLGHNRRVQAAFRELAERG